MTMTVFSSAKATRTFRDEEKERMRKRYGEDQTTKQMFVQRLHV